MINMENGEGSEIVYKLRQDSGFDELEVGRYYHARVDRLVKYGMFVRLSRRISGLVHESIFDKEYREKEELLVQLSEIKENGDLSFSPAKLYEYRTQILGEDEIVDIEQLPNNLGSFPPSSEIASIIQKKSLENGLLLLRGGSNKNVIRIMPPLIINKDEIDILLTIFKDILIKINK